jgi:hypothetical protein
MGTTKRAAGGGGGAAVEGAEGAGAHDTKRYLAKFRAGDTRLCYYDWLSDGGAYVPLARGVGALRTGRSSGGPKALALLLSRFFIPGFEWSGPIWPNMEGGPDDAVVARLAAWIASPAGLGCYRLVRAWSAWCTQELAEPSGESFRPEQAQRVGGDRFDGEGPGALDTDDEDEGEPEANPLDLAHGGWGEDDEEPDTFTPILDMAPGADAQLFSTLAASGLPAAPLTWLRQKKCRR